MLRIRFAHREGEILAWLQINDAVNEPWVALDDAEWQFDRHKDHLVVWKLLILSDLHAEFETFEVPKGLDYDVAILAGDIVAPGRVVARWLRSPARFGDKPVVQIAGNHEYYESVLDQEEAEMRRQAKEQRIHFLNCDEVVVAGVRFLGCTLWTDFALRIDIPALRDSQSTAVGPEPLDDECARYLADYSAIRVDDPTLPIRAARGAWCRWTP